MLTKHHKKYIWLFGLFLCFLVIVVLFIGGFFRNQSVFVPKLPEQTGIFTVDYPATNNYRQTGTTCGPYSVAAVMRIYGSDDISSDDVSLHIPYKIPGYGTHPLGLEKALNDFGLTSVGYRLDQSDMTDSGRAAFIRENLISNHPVIILGSKKGIQHYVTVVGVNLDTGEFYVYDSWYDAGEDKLTRDDNGELPGNNTLSEEEFLDFWRGGGLYGFYEWYALVAFSS